MNEYEQLTRVTGILNILQIIFLVLAFVSLSFAVFLFVKYKIPSVYMEISGKKKQRQLEKMQADKAVQGSHGLQFHLNSYPEASEESKAPKRSGTVDKEKGVPRKRRETRLSQKDRKTEVMDRSKRPGVNQKVHQTVAIDRKHTDYPDLEVVEEVLILAANNYIE